MFGPGRRMSRRTARRTARRTTRRQMAMYGEPEYYDDEPEYAPQAAPPPAAPAEPDVTTQLQELAKLKDLFIEVVELPEAPKRLAHRAVTCSLQLLRRKPPGAGFAPDAGAFGPPWPRSAGRVRA